MALDTQLRNQAYAKTIMDKAAPASARTPDAATRDAPEEEEVGEGEESDELDELDGDFERDVLDGDPVLLGEDAAPVAVLDGDAAADAPTPAKTGPLSVSYMQKVRYSRL